MFVKPNAIVRDSRSQEAKDQFTMQRTLQNLHHIQVQLQASGHSIEDVIAAAAKNAFGVNVNIHAPEEAFAPAGNPFPPKADAA